MKYDAPEINNLNTQAPRTIRITQIKRERGRFGNGDWIMYEETHAQTLFKRKYPPGTHNEGRTGTTQHKQSNQTLHYTSTPGNWNR